MGFLYMFILVRSENAHQCATKIICPIWQLPFNLSPNHFSSFFSASAYLGTNMIYLLIKYSK